jgi:hypothetical protein
LDNSCQKPERDKRSFSPSHKAEFPQLNGATLNFPLLTFESSCDRRACALVRADQIEICDSRESLVQMPCSADERGEGSVTRTESLQQLSCFLSFHSSTHYHTNSNVGRSHPCLKSSRRWHNGSVTRPSDRLAHIPRFDIVVHSWISSPICFLSFHSFIFMVRPFVPLLFHTFALVSPLSSLFVLPLYRTHLLSQFPHSHG